VRHYRLGAHTKSDLKVHLVFVPKYSKAVLTGEVAIRVRGLLRRSSIPGRAAEKARNSALVLVSETTMRELADVLAQPKFDHYVTLDERMQFIRLVVSTAEFVPIIHQVRECRDPRDDKFLEVALNGRADVIVTGHADLLAMHPWRGVQILSPGYCFQSVATIR
jgi:putative PIN family toxin of toxin-antitoxin system